MPTGCASGCAGARACSSSARCGTCGRSTRQGVLRAARRRRGAAVLDVAQTDFDALGLPAGALADGAQVVVAGGRDYYPGSAHLLAALLVRASPTCASPARATCSPSSSGCAASSPARGCSSRRRRSRARCCRARSASSPARAARRATTCSPGCGAAAGRGRLVWAFAPVQDRHAAPRDRARAAGPRGDARRSRSCRRARRRLARRPVRVLRRDAVPHGRAAARPGDRLGRPPHRPHADRRRRRRELLDADPRRRGRGAARLSARRARRCCARRRRACDAPRRAAPSSSARARSRALARAPAEHVARHRRDLHQRLRELRASAARGALARERALTRTRALVLRRKARRGAPATEAAERRARARRLRARARRARPRAHRSRAATRSSRTATATSSRQRRRGARGRGDVAPALPRRRGRCRTVEEAHDRATSATDLREPPPRASRRSSAGWTPARPACARRSTSSSEGRGLVEFCAGELEAVGSGLEELRLDELVARLDAQAAPPGPDGARGATRRRHEHLRPARRPAADRRRLRARGARARRLERLHAQDDRHPPARRRRGGRRRGRHLRRRRPRRRCRTRAPTLPLAGELDARRSSASTSRRSTCGREPPQREASRHYRIWALRVRRARPRAAPGRREPLHEALGPRAAAGDVRRLAAPRRADEPPDLDRVRARLERYPTLRFKLDPTPDWDDAIIAALRRHRRRRLARLQGPLRGHDRRPARRPGPLPPRRRGLPRRVARGPAS